MSEQEEAYQESSLDDLLNDDSQASEAEPEKAPEAEKPAEEPKTNTEEDDSKTPTGDKEESSPDSDNDFNDREKAFYATQKVEREKRQNLERELDELKQKFSVKEAPKEDDIDPLDDPKGFAESVKSQIEAAKLETRIATSQDIMRDKHADYDAREKQFIELAQENPALYQQMQRATSPAQFAYETAVKNERFTQFDSFDDAVKDAVNSKTADLEKSLREQLEKEYEDKLKKATSLPPSGASGGSMGTDNTAVGNDTLQDILGEK